MAVFFLLCSVLLSRFYVGYLDVAIESEGLGWAGLYLRMESFDLIIIVLYPVSVC